MANDLRVLREKVDDNNVRVGSLGQEIDALRQSVSSMNAPRPFGVRGCGRRSRGRRWRHDRTGRWCTAGSRRCRRGRLSAEAAAMVRSRTILPASTISRQSGLESYVRTFPQSPEAPEAQLRAGNSYFRAARYDKAVDAYDAVIRTYPKSRSVPEAYAKKGMALMNLRQYDRAREALEYVDQELPGRQCGSRPRAAAI